MGDHLIFLDSSKPAKTTLFLVAFSDFILSFFALIILSPIFFIVSIILLLENKGGIFFIQERIGKNQRVFKMIKFRSMVKTHSFKGNVDIKEFNKLTKEEKLSKRKEYKTTTSHDKRITAFGAIIRKTSIDELPQLFNVFLGEMSLVGPRPDPAVQVVDYSHEDWVNRCMLKPGITGMSQIYGRSELSLEKRIQNDLYYLNNFSYFLYIKILVLTIFTILKLKNVN